MELRGPESRLAVAEDGGQVVGEMSDGGQNTQTSCYKVSFGDVMYNMLTIFNNIILILYCIFESQ